MTIYDRIQTLCKNNNLTGTELGAKLGLKKSPLTDWKNRQAKPTVDQIILICKIFETNAEYIIFGKENQELGSEERLLLEAYRRADEKSKKAILANAEILAPEQKDKSLDSKTG